MPRTTLTKIVAFPGGFATDLPVQAREPTYLLRAENVNFEINGAARKTGGGARLNAAPLTGSPSVLGMFDFWVAGVAGSFTQNFVATTSNSRIFNFGSGGVATDITGAVVFGANAIPVFVQARDNLTFWWSDGSAPATWTGVGNAAVLGGAPPSARTAVFHVNRLFAGGSNANPSRLFYSSSTSITDWGGADTGSIDIDPEDGDRITGLIVHKGRLFVFKGPNKGSIHVITGTAPTGGDAFSRTLLVRGIPLQAHNSLIDVGDDVWFQSDRGVHSLSATSRSGNFQESMVTPFLQSYFRNNINRNRLTSVWGVNYAAKGSAMWAMSQSGSAINNQALGLSYLRTEEGIKPFVWNFTCQSAAIRVNPATRLREVVFGADAGFVVLMDQPVRSMPNSTAYTFRIQTPSLILGQQDVAQQPRMDQVVQLYRMWLRSEPAGDYNINVDVYRDDNTPETYTFNQGQSGFVLGTSVLDTGTLGGAGSLVVSAVDLVGECRSARFDIQQGGLNQDALVYEFGVESIPVGEHQPRTLPGV